MFASGISLTQDTVLEILERPGMLRMRCVCVGEELGPCSIGDKALISEAEDVTESRLDSATH